MEEQKSFSHAEYWTEILNVLYDIVEKDDSKVTSDQLKLDFESRLGLTFEGH